MPFDVVLTNPPFHDREQRGRTPHKLWLEFTEAALGRFLRPGGLLVQVSPGSFRSPSNRVLELMKRHDTEWIDLDVGPFFQAVGSTFATYAVRRGSSEGHTTTVLGAGREFGLRLDASVSYLPGDLCPESLGIHGKVVFRSEPKLRVEHDYVTCHNILLRRGDSLSREQSDRHVHPVFHTNRQTWWSSVRQEFAGERKVMWTRSGYTRPFYDPGRLGGTDMAYFVRVASDAEGEALAHNLNLALMRYVFASARWSGFGNERVFAALPDLPRDRLLSDDDMFELFDLTAEEVDHVRRHLG
jgi:hypothetical protein